MLAVLGGEAGGPMPVAGGDRREDGFVLDPRCLAPDPGDGGEMPANVLREVRQDPSQQLVARRLGDLRVELGVEGAHTLQVPTLEPSPATLDELAQLPMLVLLRALSGELGGALLQRLAEFEDVSDFVHGGEPDVGAGVRTQIKPPGALQEAEGFANRSAGHAEVGRDDILHEVRAWLVQPIDDPRLELVEHALRKSSVAG